MKKLLFIMDTMPLGGISKSLLALLNEIADEYEIDLLLMKQEGMFIPLIPDKVQLLPEPIETAFRNPHPKNVINALKGLSFSRFGQWLLFSKKCCFARITGGLPKMICIMDTCYAKLANRIEKHYDAGIAYQGGRCIYYLVERVDADIKIGYVHNDYSASKIDFMMKPSDRLFFPLLDNLVTISPKCLESLRSEFPEIHDKCYVVENICSPKMIKAMAQNGESFSDGFEGIRLVTMGRFDINQKGIDYAISACKILKERKICFKWYFVGDGAERGQIENLIRQNMVKDEFILLGAKTNPYPFIKDSDIYVQPSRFEGKSVALDEVKALQKPVVVTSYSTVFDQFVDGKTALIAQMNAEDIADKIEILIRSKSMRDMLSSNLAEEKVGNEEQAEVFKSLLA